MMFVLQRRLNYIAVLTEIKNAISILGDAEFQEFCDIMQKNLDMELSTAWV